MYLILSEDRGLDPHAYLFQDQQMYYYYVLYHDEVRSHREDQERWSGSVIVGNDEVASAMIVVFDDHRWVVGIEMVHDDRYVPGTVKVDDDRWVAGIEMVEDHLPWNHRDDVLEDLLVRICALGILRLRPRRRLLHWRSHHRGLACSWMGIGGEIQKALEVLAVVPKGVFRPVLVFDVCFWTRT